MKLFRGSRIIIFASIAIILILIIAVSLSALAASNTVASSRIGMFTQGIALTDFLPAGCAALTIVNVINCPGTASCNGTGESDLIFGDSANNVIDGKNSADCIIAGGGDDDVKGGGGGDICVEGPGTDSYKNCTVVNP